MLSTGTLTALLVAAVAMAPARAKAPEEELSGAGPAGVCAGSEAAEIFAAQDCSRCHSVADATGERVEVPAARTPPSAGALRRGAPSMSVERLTKLLVRRMDGRGMRHPVTWRGKQPELNCVLAWLVGEDGPGETDEVSGSDELER